MRGGPNPGGAPSSAADFGGTGRPETLPAHPCPPSHLLASFALRTVARRSHGPGRRTLALPEVTGESGGSTRGPRRADKPWPRLAGRSGPGGGPPPFVNPRGSGRPGTFPPAPTTQLGTLKVLHSQGHLLGWGDLRRRTWKHLRATEAPSRRAPDTHAAVTGQVRAL
ncbi:hypothetical protein NDU88_002232 [Pleurodeles waltl]|uniref:Uncharacterized protein n=1 Tax=Pleurodeles waltl TaxID=8319 RepID=A0AAV7TJY5_PLEWA|nr:hypothetical protein NDU88_002232 [Pleurodeles waltl]